MFALGAALPSAVAVAPTAPAVVGRAVEDTVFEACRPARSDAGGEEVGVLVDDACGLDENVDDPFRLAIPAIDGFTVELCGELLDNLGPFVVREPEHGDDAVVIGAALPAAVRHRGVPVAQVLGGTNRKAVLVDGALEVVFVVVEVRHIAIVRGEVVDADESLRVPADDRLLAVRARAESVVVAVALEVDFAEDISEHAAAEARVDVGHEVQHSFSPCWCEGSVTVSSIPLIMHLSI